MREKERGRKSGRLMEVFDFTKREKNVDREREKDRVTAFFLQKLTKM